MTNHTLPVQLYEAVPVTPETMPEKKGWYNITSDALPNPCGRAYYDGVKFNFSRSSATGGILESGGTLFYLRPFNPESLVREIAGKVWEASMLYNGMESIIAEWGSGVNNHPDQTTFTDNLIAELKTNK